MKTKLKKAIEWLKDNWDIPYWRCYWAWRDIRGWCRHNLNRYHLNVVKEAWFGYPFDFAFLYYIEKAKLEEMREYFRHAHWIDQALYDNYIRELTWAINCLDIMIDDDVKTDTKVNTRNWKRFRPEFSKQSADWVKDFLKRFPGEIRTEKARHLYYKILLERSQSWWD